MTLETVMEMEFSYNDIKSKEFALSRIIFEIKSEWNIETVEDDFTPIIVSTPRTSMNGEDFYAYTIYFNPTQQLLDKFQDYPEALV